MEKDMVGVKWHQRDGARWETVPARDGVDEGRQETVVVRRHRRGSMSKGVGKGTVGEQEWKCERGSRSGSRI